LWASGAIRAGKAGEDYEACKARRGDGWVDRLKAADRDYEASRASLLVGVGKQ